MMEERSIIGKPLVRKDAQAKVLGNAMYAGDVRMHGLLVGRALRSQYASAKILSIDTSEALKVPGVHAVLTARDIPGVNRFGIAIQDQQVLADGRVRMMGDAVALVAAETMDDAEEALYRIKVEYEETPGVYTIEEAIREGAPLVHEGSPGNILQHTVVRKGNIQEGFDKSRYLIENTYTTQRVEHAYIEPETSVAFFDQHGTINVLSSTQYAFRDRRQVAPVLGMPFNMVRVTQMTTGGAFGGKDDITTEIQAALLAYHTRRPVRVSWTRSESMMCSTKRHPMKIHVKTGCDQNGMLQVMEGTLYSDKGAYCSIGNFITKKAGLHLSGPYFIPNISVDTYAVYTNNTICGPYRGFGILQASFAHESQMDQLSELVGMSPWEFRMRNALRHGLSTATGQVFEQGVGFVDTLQRAKEYMDSQEL